MNHLKSALESLEPRFLLADPSISGPSSATEGLPYTLTLSPNDATDIQSWTINWGDGTVQVIAGSPPTVEHTFADGPNRFAVSATAQGASQTYNAGSIGSSVGVVGEPNFGGYGEGRGGVQIDSTNASPTTFESVRYPDGRFLQVGSYHFAPFDAIQLTRHLTNGAPDHSFGVNGKVLGLQSINAAFASGVALQNDGKIIVSTSVEGTYHNFSVLRFNEDGSLDHSFGVGGMVTYDYAGEADAATDILYDPFTGRIFVGGDVRDGDFHSFAVLALDDTGDIDTTFGNQGWATYEYPGSIYTAGSTMALDGDGNILIAGKAAFSEPGVIYQRGVVARFDSGGNLDTSFGDNGAHLFHFGYDDGEINDMVVLNDGRIGLTGAGNISGGINVVAYVALLTEDGDLDPVFGRRPVDLTTFSAERLYGLAVDPQNRLVAGGSITTSGNTDFLAVRFNLTGTLDTTFGNNGKLAITFPTNPPGVTTDEVDDVLIDPHGNITLVGTEYDSGPQFAFLAFARLTASPGGVFVQNANPALNVAGPAQAIVNAPYAVDFSSLDTGDDTRLQWHIDWGDGTTETFPGSSISAQHTFTQTRDFTISVTAFDEDGAYQKTKAVSIITAPPFIDGEGVLHIVGREIAEAIDLSVLGATLRVTLGSLVYDFPAEQVQRINFRTGGGFDNVVINAGIPGGDYVLDSPGFAGGAVSIALKPGLSPAVPFNISTASAGTIAVEPGTGASISVGGPGSPRLRLLGTPGNDIIALGASSVLALGNQITYSDLTSFVIESGDGDDTITANLPTPASSQRFINITAGGGNDLIQFLAGTFNPQNSVNGGDGDDRVEIHDGIRGAFSVGGDAGNDTLIVEGTSGADLFLVTANGIDLAGNLLRDVFLRTSTPDRISTTEFIEIHGLGGDDVVSTAKTPPNLVFVGGAGADTFSTQYPAGTPVTYTLAGDVFASTFGVNASIEAETLQITSFQASTTHLVVNDTPAFDVRYLPTGPASLTINSGIFTCIPDAIAVGTNVAVHGSAALRIDSSPHFGQLALNPGATARLMPGGSKTLFVTGITIADDALLDLADGQLVASVPADQRDALLAYLNSRIRLGRRTDGDWAGAEGVTSSSARDDESGLTGLALVPTAEGARIKYSWNGDSDANGVVNKDDYARIDRGFLRGLTALHQGNFDYNDVIDILDYLLIDQAFLGQTKVL